MVWPRQNRRSAALQPVGLHAGRTTSVRCGCSIAAAAAAAAADVAIAACDAAAADAPRCCYMLPLDWSSWFGRAICDEIVVLPPN